MEKSKRDKSMRGEKSREGMEMTGDMGKEKGRK